MEDNHTKTIGNLMYTCLQKVPTWNPRVSVFLVQRNDKKRRGRVCRLFVGDIKSCRVFQEVDRSRVINYTPNYGENANGFVLDARGITLEELRVRCGGHLPLHLASSVAQQGLRALAAVHDKHYVLRNVSMDSFVFDTQRRELHLVDVFWAKKGTRCTKCAFVPEHALRWASPRVLAGLQPGYADDVYAFINVMTHLCQAPRFSPHMPSEVVRAWKDMVDPAQGRTFMAPLFWAFAWAYVFLRLWAAATGI